MVVQKAVAALNLPLARLLFSQECTGVLIARGAALPSEAIGLQGSSLLGDGVARPCGFVRNQEVSSKMTAFSLTVQPCRIPDIAAEDFNSRRAVGRGVCDFTSSNMTGEAHAVA